MQFEINNMQWYIMEINNEEMQYEYGKNDSFTHGITIYSENMIYLNKETPEMYRTLKHELMHVWLYAFGHVQDDKEFTNEDVCEIVASSNDFLNDIVEKYKKYIKEK